MEQEASQTYSIRQVINLTGVSEYTLRAWELRYQAFTPHRTPTGRRCYHQEDLLKIRALKDLLNQGHRIGEVAPLPLDLLQQLLETPENPKASTKSPLADKTPPQAKWVEPFFTRATRHDWAWIQKELSKRRAQFSINQFVQETVLPITQEMAMRVYQETFSIGQEHILSALLKDQLAIIRTATLTQAKSSQKYVITTPEGDIHDLGIAIAAALIHSEGHDVLYLGPNTPGSDLVDVCMRYKPTHVLISSVVTEKEGAKQSFFTYIEFLDQHLNKSVTLITGGRSAAEVDLHSGRPCHYFSHLTALVEYLKEH